ncbi:hypothetical protein DR950_17755 [Kitasatospora xanthocidica]|uniref:Uncharacterized protein n=1 Tax=Kitasatospora xanthocidica TaxID=83382 RepID=A0A372ZU40_9ACTN|nr:hypothetical protein [Kitasatospora xanthocidica]RGD59389.1 hypothetical protein DR950_17755 [Kitasatospora xanthocidica]
MTGPRPRWRLRLDPPPRRALVLAQAPDPECRHCEGAGGWDGNPLLDDYVTCVCHDPSRRLTLLRLHRRPADRP